MSANLRRVAALERKVTTQSALTEIVCRGGLPGNRENDVASLAYGRTLQRGEDETVEEFRIRARAWAREAGEKFLVLGGLPNEEDGGI